MDHNINTDLLHLKNVIYTHILENQNYFAEFHFGMADQFMTDITENLFNGVYAPVANYVVIAATVDTLRMQVNIV